MEQPPLYLQRGSFSVGANQSYSAPPVPLTLPFSLAQGPCLVSMHLSIISTQHLSPSGVEGLFSEDTPQCPLPAPLAHSHGWRSVSIQRLRLAQGLLTKVPRDFIVSDLPHSPLCAFLPPLHSSARILPRGCGVVHLLLPDRILPHFIQPTASTACP